MKEYIRQLKKYIAEHPLDFGDGDAESILEMLHWYYAECNPIYNDQIRQLYARLDRLMEGVSIKENNAVLNVVCDLCAEHQRLAFIAGVKVGILLEQEIA